jgi:hypothetical protein
LQRGFVGTVLEAAFSPVKSEVKYAVGAVKKQWPLYADSMGGGCLCSPTLTSTFKPCKS